MTIKTVMIGEKKYKLPFLEHVPFSKEQSALLKSSIADAQAVLVPIICWKQKSTATTFFVVDGAHRAVYASELGLGKIPVQMRSFDSEEEALAECERINHDRRHLTQQELEAGRRSRIERVASARRNGQSTRQIAKQENVSQTQVLSDLKASTEQGCSVDPPEGKIQSQDGRARPSRMTLCARCQRVGPVKDCPKCKEARGTKPPAKEAEESGPKDAFGKELPKRCRDAYCDSWIQEAYDFLTVFSEKFRMERLMEGMKKRAKRYPFFNEKDFVDGCGFIIDYLDKLIEHLKTFRPAGVCPKCEGAGCSDCRSSGLVPRGLYKELKK